MNEAVSGERRRGNSDQIVEDLKKVPEVKIKVADAVKGALQHITAIYKTKEYTEVLLEARDAVEKAIESYNPLEENDDLVLLRDAVCEAFRVVIEKSPDLAPTEVSIVFFEELSKRLVENSAE